jgi:hypothetical protein
LKTELGKVSQLEEISCRQKYRILWLQEGDNNTRFFRSMANSHKRTNFIGELEVDGTPLTEEEDIRGAIVDFYIKTCTKRM